MKILFVFASAVALAFGQDTTVATETETETGSPLKLEGEIYSPTPMTRDLPADVLRDFVGLCFASTLCKVFNVGQSWNLAPFCGTATCLVSPQGILIERVQDCGIMPKPNARCEIINNDARNETFPACCPKFQCEKGVTLEFPTPEELQAAAQAEAQAQAQAQAQAIAEAEAQGQGQGIGQGTQDAATPQ